MTIDAYEPNPTSFETLQKSVFERNIWGDSNAIRLINAPLTAETQFPAEYDIITAFHVCYHFPQTAEERKRIFRNLFNGLKDGGVLAVKHAHYAGFGRFSDKPKFMWRFASAISPSWIQAQLVNTEMLQCEFRDELGARDDYTFQRKDTEVKILNLEMCGSTSTSRWSMVICSRHSMSNGSTNLNLN